MVGLLTSQDRTHEAGKPWEIICWWTTGAGATPVSADPQCSKAAVLGALLWWLCLSSCLTLEGSASLQVLLPPEQVGSRAGARPHNARLEDREMGILAVVSFYLQQLICTVLIMLSYQPVP